MMLRGNRFYLRRHVPTDVQPIIGRAEVWRSLKTDSLQTALRRLPLMTAALESEFERVRHDAGLTVDETILRPSGDDLRATLLPSRLEAQGSAAPPPLSLEQAYARYMDDPTHHWSPSTRQAYETTRKFAVGIIGGEIEMEALSRAQCRDYLDALRFMPRNASKRFPKLSLRAASELGRQGKDIELISAANANAHLANFSSFLNWAINEEVIARNPIRGLRLPDMVAKKDKRHPFSAEQLQAIFNAPLYRGCQDGERGYAKPGREHPRNARFWVPLIALHTGMRLNEICQLDTTDIREIEGVLCFVVSETSLVGETDKSLKTGASERLIPLHPSLIACGILAYVEAQRRAKRVKLFPDIDPGPRGKRAVAFSKWFTQFIRSCDAYQPRTSFHSFRHNFRDELRAAQIDHDIAMVLGGWATGRNSSIASENYGGGHRVGSLYNAITKLSFAKIDLSHIIDKG
jgi:integrase